MVCFSARHQSETHKVFLHLMTKILSEGESNIHRCYLFDCEFVFDFEFVVDLLHVIVHIEQSLEKIAHIFGSIFLDIVVQRHHHSNTTATQNNL